MRTSWLMATSFADDCDHGVAINTCTSSKQQICKTKDTLKKQQTEKIKRK